MTRFNFHRRPGWVVLLVVIGMTAGCGPGSSASVIIPPLKTGDAAAHSPAEEAVIESGAGTLTENSTDKKEAKMETATFAAGCYWCVEAVFQKLKGVEGVKSGFMGGAVKNPTYNQVVSGLTGHAEVIQFEFDPEVITYSELLEVFWSTHDPTTLNQQGNDRGTQYRSAVFFQNDSQEQLANKYKQQLNEEKAFPSPVVTEVTEASEFYEADAYHQNYFNNNQNQPYCRAVIPPKLEKLKKIFADKLR